MKLTNNRYYFDYNSTSPLAKSVKKWISSGDLFLANANSLHTSGKKTLKLIRQTENFLFETFQLSKSHNLFFHSGASEGINTFLINEISKDQDEKNLILFETDHSSAYKIKNVVDKYKVNLHIKNMVNEKGELSVDELIQFLKTLKGRIILNYTWVNNETGAVWPLEDAIKIKQMTGAFIHVDATQAVCKIPDWNQLSGELDCYSFSGHKFGALTGVGFSFYLKNYPVQFLINGAKGVLHSRPGTPNAVGIYSMYLALNESMKKYNFRKSEKALKFLMNELDELLQGSGKVLNRHLLHQASNTICLFFYQKKGQDLVNLFDLNKIEVGVGSACSSGILAPNRVLMAMGIPEDQSNNSIRLSFAPDLNLIKAKEYFEVLKSVFNKTK